MRCEWQLLLLIKLSIYKSKCTLSLSPRTHPPCARCAVIGIKVAIAPSAQMRMRSEPLLRYSVHFLFFTKHLFKFVATHIFFFYSLHLLKRTYILN